jgi:DNA-binding transcriptional LysR family regulator
MGSTEAVRQGIKNKAGISILSTIAVEGDLKEGSLKALAIEGLSLKRSFYLTRHRQRSLSPICNAFILHMKNELCRS